MTKEAYIKDLKQGIAEHEKLIAEARKKADQKIAEIESDLKKGIEWHTHIIKGLNEALNK